jgi:glycerophosphoryl diester phosphodiesterase
MWIYPDIVAHRGGGKLAPENTLAGLRCALEHGFAAVEFDVMLARDGVPVVMHDPYLGRTVAGSGNVFDFDAMELVAMDAGVWFGTRFRGEPVPLLSQFIEFCQQHRIWMNIEIKPAPGFEAETGRVVAELTGAMFAADLGRAAPSKLPLLSSFSELALDAAMRAVPALARALLFDVVPPDFAERAHALGAVAIHANQKKLSARGARAIKDAGFGLFCYTVNDLPRARELSQWGVDGFCTDRLDIFKPSRPSI